jgi:hypothetical protein
VSFATDLDDLATALLVLLPLFATALPVRFVLRPTCAPARSMRFIFFFDDVLVCIDAVDFDGDRIAEVDVAVPTTTAVIIAIAKTK